MISIFRFFAFYIMQAFFSFRIDTVRVVVRVRVRDNARRDGVECLGLGWVGLGWVKRDGWNDGICFFWGRRGGLEGG